MLHLGKFQGCHRELIDVVWAGEDHYISSRCSFLLNIRTLASFALCSAAVHLKLSTFRRLHYSVAYWRKLKGSTIRMRHANVIGFGSANSSLSDLFFMQLHQLAKGIIFLFILSFVDVPGYGLRQQQWLVARVQSSKFSHRTQFGGQGSLI